jgi:glycosyltransferase involved in cell wall biosynthesis
VKVLHVVYSFPPDSPGGTEIYVAQLCRDLGRLETDTERAGATRIASVVAAPASAEAAYEWDGIAVRRFSCAPGEQSLDELYGGGDAAAAASFARLLDRERPDLLHQHALSPACSTLLMRAARARAIPVVFTYHTPAVSCQRGTLLQFGREVCSGVIGQVPCASCVLDSRGLNLIAQAIAAAVPVDIGRSVGARGLSGGVWTAIRMTSLLERRALQLRELFDTVDRFVALSPWVSALLTANGVAPARITCSPHGVPPAVTTHTIERSDARPPRRSSAALRLVYVGRLDPAKGAELVVRAVRHLRGIPVELDLFGTVQDETDERAANALRAMAESDGRIRVLPAVSHSDVRSVMEAYDAVVVPSQIVETGPLVVLEAFAAGVPVIGSALGGIADKVRHEVNGLLVAPPDSQKAWLETLGRCALDLDRLARLRSGIGRPRSSVAVAADMAALYDDVLRVGEAREAVHG